MVRGGPVNVHRPIALAPKKLWRKTYGTISPKKCFQIRAADIPDHRTAGSPIRQSIRLDDGKEFGGISGQRVGKLQIL